MIANAHLTYGITSHKLVTVDSIVETLTYLQEQQQEKKEEMKIVTFAFNVWLLFSSAAVVDAFVVRPPAIGSRNVCLSSSTSQTEPLETKAEKNEKQTLGLLTFDLDDTLYPVSTVLEEANGR